MKIRRNKAHRRTLRFFRLNYGVQDPFRVLVDGTFLTHSLQHKYHVREQLPKLLEGRCTPMVTSCVLAELRSLGDKALGAAIIAKGYYRVKCGHDSPISAAACIRCQLGERNDRKVIVATQDAELARGLRTIPGVPLLRMDGPVPRVEEISDASKRVATEGEASKARASDWEKQKLPELKAREAQAQAQAAAAKLAVKKRRGPKGPNPLSCKKRKAAEPKAPASAAPATAAAVGSGGKKRVRSRRMAGSTGVGAAVTNNDAPIADAASATGPGSPPAKKRRVRSRRMSGSAAVGTEDA